MAEDLADRCAQLNIREEENEIIDLGSVGSDKTTVKTSLMLVGKVLSERAVNLEALRRTMTQIWALHRNMVVRAIGTNTFVFQFFHWKDKEKILDGRPWCFDQKLLVIDTVNGDEQPSQVKLDTSPFWVRIYNLPFNCRTEVEIRAIASCLGLVMEVDVDEFGLERFCRVKILLNVSKPLRRKQRIRRKDGTLTTIEYKYERLPHFCFRCGILGHSEKDCNEDLTDEFENEMGWGVWLKASPLKGKARNKEEELAIKARRRKLFVPKEEKVDDRQPLLIAQGREQAEVQGENGEGLDKGWQRGEGQVISQRMQSHKTSEGPRVAGDTFVGGTQDHKKLEEDKGASASLLGDKESNDEHMIGHNNESVVDGNGMLDPTIINHVPPISTTPFYCMGGPKLFEPIFNVGSHLINTKKVNVKKKAQVRKTAILEASHVQNPMAEVPLVSQMGAEFDADDDMEMIESFSGKRKAAKEDMWKACSSNEGERKKVKCAPVQGPELNQVAEVGTNQPREQQ